MTCKLTHLHATTKRSSHRWSGTDSRAWLQRINQIYPEVRAAEAPTLEQARGVLFDAASRSSEIERMLLALIDHRDLMATELLEHRALSFSLPRLAFIHRLARRRRQRVWRVISNQDDCVAG